MVEIKLPKCLTEKEANLIRDYNDLILSKLPEEERARMIPRFLASVDCPQRGPRYSPFKSIDDVETNTECFNKKLYMGLLDAYEANTYDNSLPTPEVVLMLFNGAYAMSIHALNHKNPELYYEEGYRNIWWTGKVDADFGNEIDVHMEHICACMIYRILEAENNPRYDVLLRKIKNLIKGSYFVQADTLDLFKHTIVSATPPTPNTEDTPINNTQTEHSTEEERPKLRKNKIDTRKGRYLIFSSLEQQQYWAQVFVDFLKAHNKSQESLSTEAANYINRTFACFHQQWEKHKLLNTDAHKKAYTLFLTNDCGIDGIAEKTYSNNVDKTLTKALEYENRSTASTMLIKIEELVKKEAERFTT